MARDDQARDTSGQFADARLAEAPESIRLPTDELRNDASCTIPWRADSFEAIAVYVDPRSGTAPMSCARSRPRGRERTMTPTGCPAT